MSTVLSGHRLEGAGGGEGGGAAKAGNQTRDKHSVKRGEKTRDVHLRRRSFLRRHTEPAVASAILLVLVSILASSTLTECLYDPLEARIEEFNLFERHGDEIHVLLRQVVDTISPRVIFSGCVYLGAKDAEKYGTAPARWIKFPLRGETAEDRVTLAFSESDLYLVAFQNNEGTWHAFKGFEHMFPGAVILNPDPQNPDDAWDESYTKLVVGGRDNLVTVPLGKESALLALRTLARYRQGITPLPLLKTSLVRYMIMFSEAMRFRPIREAFGGDLWNTETHITKLHTKYIKHWAEMSYFVFKWEKEGIWDNNRKTRRVTQDTKISNAEEAVAIMEVLRRPYELRVLDYKPTVVASP